MKVTDNNKMRVVFADDELPAREKLSHQLSLIPNIELVGFATTGKEAVALINKEKPDLALLDIQMPEINGLDLLSLLEVKPLIIYTTAYDQFAIQAFEEASTDYLLKPFPLARLKAAIDKAQKQYVLTLFEAQQNNNSHTMALQPTSDKKLVSKNGERIILLPPSDIYFIKSEQGNSMAWDNDKFHYLSEKLDILEGNLASQQFVRIHRSYLVNIDKIKEIQRWFNGKLMLIMSDDRKTELSTSRAGADKLKKCLGF